MNRKRQPRKTNAKIGDSTLPSPCRVESGSFQEYERNRRLFLLLRPMQTILDVRPLFRLVHDSVTADDEAEPTFWPTLMRPDYERNCKHCLVPNLPKLLVTDLLRLNRHGTMEFYMAPCDTAQFEMNDQDTVCEWSHVCLQCARVMHQLMFLGASIVRIIISSVSSGSSRIPWISHTILSYLYHGFDPMY